MLRSVGEQRWHAKALETLGVIVQSRGRLGDARAALYEAAEVSRTRRDRGSLVIATTNLGRVALTDGDPTEVELLGRRMDLARRLTSSWSSKGLR